MTIEVRCKLGPDGEVPLYMTAGCAGCDVFASEHVMLFPGYRALVSTNLFIEVPDGFECQIRPRSGLALAHGITVLNAPGTIDSDYRGEVRVILVNLGSDRFDVFEGMRIAQLVFAPVTRATFTVVDDLGQTGRGARGFGSTGTKEGRE